MKLSKILLASALVFGLGACTTESENEAIDNVDQAELDEAVDSEQAEEIEADTTEGDKYEGVVGDTLSFDGVSITLDEVNDSPSAFEDTHVTPELEDGIELVNCDLTILNETGMDLDFDLNAFSMENNNGDVAAPSSMGVTSSDSSEFVAGVFKIKDGESATVFVAFEEPEGSSPLILNYLKDTTTDKEQTLSWTIDR